MQTLKCGVLALSVALSTCSGEQKTQAVISVRLDPKTVQDDKFLLNVVRSHLCSIGFLRHVNQEVGLETDWELSEDGVIAELRRVITVTQGSGPSLFVLQARGLDRETAVRILNTLCDYYAAQKFELRHPSGESQVVHVEVVQGAE